MKATKKLLCSAIAASALSAGAAQAVEGLSANAGVMSEYYFRGILQNETATANAGIDYENSGFYAGSWVADVDDGLEIDGYLGYGVELENGLSGSIGYTGYFYTGDFDSEYNEINLNVGFGPVSVEYTVGTQEEDASLTIAEADYTFLAVTVEHNGFYVTFGSFGDDADGDYWEAGYGTEIGGFDAGVAVLTNDDELAGGDSEETLMFSVSKSFDI